MLKTHMTQEHKTGRTLSSIAVTPGQREKLDKNRGQLLAENKKHQLTRPSNNRGCMYAPKQEQNQRHHGQAKQKKYQMPQNSE